MRRGNSMRARRSFGRQATQSGYTLVVLLLLVALTSVALAVVGPIFAQNSQRDKEQDLLRVGALYAKALQAYYDAAPGNLRRYPLSLDLLLLDTRYVGTVRHLRQNYPDPVQPGIPWGLVRDANGGIVGVYSTSALRPLAQGAAHVPRQGAAHYSDWKFIVKTQP